MQQVRAGAAHRRDAGRARRVTLIRWEAGGQWRRARWHVGHRADRRLVARLGRLAALWQGGGGDGACELSRRCALALTSRLARWSGGTPGRRRAGGSLWSRRRAAPAGSRLVRMAGRGAGALVSAVVRLKDSGSRRLTDKGAPSPPSLGLVRRRCGSLTPPSMNGRSGHVSHQAAVTYLTEFSGVRCGSLTPPSRRRRRLGSGCGCRRACAAWCRARSAPSSGPSARSRGPALPRPARAPAWALPGRSAASTPPRR